VGIGKRSWRIIVGILVLLALAKEQKLALLEYLKGL
jgi:hypothetical protein